MPCNNCSCGECRMWKARARAFMRAAQRGRTYVGTPAWYASSRVTLPDPVWNAWRVAHRYYATQGGELWRPRAWHCHKCNKPNDPTDEVCDTPECDGKRPS